MGTTETTGAMRRNNLLTACGDAWRTFRALREQRVPAETRWGLGVFGATTSPVADEEYAASQEYDRLADEYHARYGRHWTFDCEGPEGNERGY